jgi:hypothetical protein
MLQPISFKLQKDFESCSKVIFLEKNMILAVKD